nr:zinc-ribbon domain-containing protein [uncultured Methanoregula sp.]
MAYPDLYNDESVLLNALNVKVKSVTFEAVLTTKRLILVDSKKHLIAPQEILLATLRNVESGENAIRDPTITLSLITNSGATRQMILTFFKASGGDRRRECDEWIRLLKQNISPTFQQTVHASHDIPPPEPAPEFVPQPEAPPTPRIEITNAPQPKKKIEIARPIMKIVENPPSMPKPVETTSLPVGSFCNRCGNRVPPESAFCNRCGTPVVRDPDQVPPAEPAPEAAAPVITPPVSPPPSAIPQLHVPIPPPVFGSAAGERKERPIEQVIHSIEPLIEDSVPRTEPAPLIQRPVSTLVTPAQPAEPAPEPAAHAEPAPAPDSGNVQWPVITPAGGEAPAPAPAVPETPAPVPPPAPPARKASGRKKVIAIALAAIIILAIIGSAILFMNPQGTTPATATPTTATTIPTTAPAVTATATPTETVAVIAPVATPMQTTTTAAQQVIPSSGVWIRIIYPGIYSATFGTPGAESTRTDTGDHVYQVFTSTGIVVASVQKVDASGQEIQVEVYKDGNQVAKKSTTAPKGIVEIQADLKPTPTPTTLTPVPVTTTATISAGANATANSTQATP